VRAERQVCLVASALMQKRSLVSDIMIKSSEENTQQVAEAVSAALYSRDHTSHMLGIVVETVSPGSARLSMTVRQDMVNGHGILHGGLCFTLADTCLAHACHSRNIRAVTHSCTITYTAPGHLGDELIAEGQEIWTKERNSMVDVTVSRRSDGAVIALLRGNVRYIGGVVTEQPPQ